MRANEVLNEIHYSDLYPKQFVEFRNKYLPLVGDKSLYVNFTDAVSNTVNKTFSNNPNHRDPIGLYAYPLEYVLNHPADIEYGQQAPYLRVIRDTSKNKVVLNTVTHEQAVDYLTKMGIDNPEKRMAHVARKYKMDYGGNLPGHQLFGVMQVYRETGQKMVTPNAIQTQLLLKAGIDALEDRSQNRAQSIIYSGEPEQIIFLQRNAFKVVDIFDLRKTENRRLDRTDPRENLKRLAGLIAQKIGDRVVASNIFDRAEKLSVYTAKKRKIVVSLGYGGGYEHRTFSTFTDHPVSVSLMGPDFQMISVNNVADKSFEEIAEQMYQAFLHREPAQKRGFDLWSDMGPQAEKSSYLMTEIAKRLKVPFVPPSTKQEKLRLHMFMQQVDSLHFFTQANTIPVFRKSVSAIADRMFGANNQMKLQVIAVMNAVTSSKRIGRSYHKFENIARALKIDTTVMENIQEDVREYPNVKCYRIGTDVYIETAGKAQKIASIDNMRLVEWKKPDENKFNSYVVFLPFAKELRDYLNEFEYTAEGYLTFMVQFYGISYVGGEWKVFEDASTRERVGDIDLWTYFPNGENRNGYVMAMADGQTHYEVGNGIDVPWRSQEVLLFMKDASTIDHIGKNMLAYVQKQNSTNSWFISRYEEDLYLGNSDAPNLIFEKLSAANFDLLDYIKKKGYRLSPSMQSHVLTNLGLVKNEQNGKIGKTWGEVAADAGVYAGKQTYVIKQHGRLYFVFALDEADLQTVPLIIELPHGNKQSETIHDVNDNLTLDERKAIRELIKQRGLTIPDRFRAVLALK